MPHSSRLLSKKLESQGNSLINTHGLAVFVLFVSLALCLSQTAWAAPEEEIEFLSLYFTEVQLVEAPTRYPKSLSQVAENVTIITAKEIEAMNAHTLTEVLERDAGVFLTFFHRDFGSPGGVHIHGSQTHHTLVLVDGIRWNFLSGGNAVTNDIPVRIIDRIEIIKGPASSTWGSALGGVINVITKNVENSPRPSGSIHASYGERDSQDYSGEVTGKLGRLGYYFYTGRQDSDGLRDDRFFDNDSFYSKIQFDLPRDMFLSLTTGYTDPHFRLGDFPASDLRANGNSRSFFATATFDTRLTDELGFNMSVHTIEKKFVQNFNVLGTGALGPAGDFFQATVWDEETDGANGRLVWNHSPHTAVLGVEIERGELDQIIDYGPFWQAFGFPQSDIANTAFEETWAIYANDTINWGKFTVTPGLRYDHHSISDNFLSPSLGVTCRLSEATILRGTAARGFTNPWLSAIAGGGDLFTTINPDLGPEKVWSTQAGVESAAAGFMRFKASVFRHHVKDSLEFNDTLGFWVNTNKNRRTGFELEADTVPFFNVSLAANYVYVYEETFGERGNDDRYAVNLRITYDDRKSLQAKLYGNYSWWPEWEKFAKSDEDFIWNFTLTKRIFSREKTDMKIFFKAHNIFNGGQYWADFYKNPRRWIEGGVKLFF